MDRNVAGIFPTYRWFDDFAVGMIFAYGRWDMRKDEMLAFARTYDPEPFHIDEAAAIAEGWGGLIASGPLIGAIFRRLSKDAFPNTETVISPGWDRIRWLRPVYAGDVLTCRSEVVAARRLQSRPDQGLIKMQNDILRGEERVCAILSNWFVRARPPAENA